MRLFVEPIPAQVLTSTSLRRAQPAPWWPPTILLCLVSIESCSLTVGAMCCAVSVGPGAWCSVCIHAGIEVLSRRSSRSRPNTQQPEQSSSVVHRVPTAQLDCGATQVRSDAKQQRPLQHSSVTLDTAKHTVTSTALTLRQAAGSGRNKCLTALELVPLQDHQQQRVESHSLQQQQQQQQQSCAAHPEQHPVCQLNEKQEQWTVSCNADDLLSFSLWSLDLANYDGLATKVVEASPSTCKQPGHSMTKGVLPSCYQETGFTIDVEVIAAFL